MFVAKGNSALAKLGRKIGASVILRAKQAVAALLALHEAKKGGAACWIIKRNNLRGRQFLAGDFPIDLLANLVEKLALEGRVGRLYDGFETTLLDLVDKRVVIGKSCKT